MRKTWMTCAPARRTAVLGLGILLTATLLPAATPAQAATYTAPAFASKVPAATTQVIRTARTNRWCGAVYCTATQAWSKVNGQWHVVIRTDGSYAWFRSTIGPKGFAPIGAKREGDGRTPSGVYWIPVTFSTTTTNPGVMPWRRRLPTSIVTPWANHLYNTWIEQAGRTDGNRASMRYGFWVGYNYPRLKVDYGPKPVLGMGSGIFYHTAPIGKTWSPTQGCVQVGMVDQMQWIVKWLRPGAYPRVVNNI
jgi:L,D-peptidoglycan transpeptidase YkuD (ErfK/YbiS/YcfS/YnhG family)